MLTITDEGALEWQLIYNDPPPISTARAKNMISEVTPDIRSDMSRVIDDLNFVTYKYNHEQNDEPIHTIHVKNVFPATVIDDDSGLPYQVQG